MNSLIDQGKKAMVLDRIRRHEMPLCVMKPKCEGINKKVNGKKQQELDYELRVAAWNGDCKEVEELIKKGANVNCQDKDTGRTPLIDAAMRGKDKAIELLIKKGADVNFRSEGMTALAYALENRKHKCVLMLRKHGAKE